MRWSAELLAQWETATAAEKKNENAALKLLNKMVRLQRIPRK